MMPRKKTNPAHHNAGRLPNFNQDLTRHLSYINFTLKGFAGNIAQAERLISGDHRSEHWDELPAAERNKIIEFNWKLRNLALEAKDLADDVAEFNRDKTKLNLPPTKKLPMRGG